MKWFADRAKWNIEIGRKEGHTVPDVRATVRFAVYSDLDLAQNVVKILRESTGWPVEIDGSNKPTLMRDTNGFKVVFDIGPMRTFNEIACAFSDGELLGEGIKVGQKTPDARYDEMEHLIIDILPVTS